MAHEWIEVTDDDQPPFWKQPLFLFVGVIAILAIVVTAGIILSQRGKNGDTTDNVAIQDLKADQDFYDGQTVVLIGEVGTVYQLPVLDQYAIYSFDDGTGDMWVLSDKGVPPEDEEIELTAVFNAAITLDKQLERIIEDQFGSIVGAVVENIVPEIPLNVVYLRHEKYRLLE